MNKFLAYATIAALLTSPISVAACKAANGQLDDRCDAHNESPRGMAQVLTGTVTSTGTNILTVPDPTTSVEYTKRWPQPGVARI